METLKNTAGSARKPGPPHQQRNHQERGFDQAQSDLGFYRRLFHLKNGQRVMLRLLQERDRHHLIDLFQKASVEDIWFFKHDVRNRSLTTYWLNHLDYRRLLPLVALNPEDNQLIAAATLLRGQHTAHHIGEIELFIARPFRNLGLGSILLDELIRWAGQEKLRWLKAEVVADHKQMVT
ncbi:MAG: GNAT family N-acetyltransferase, partial [Desulfobaccales bacterium]